MRRQIAVLLSAAPLTPMHLVQATLRHQGLRRHRLTARHIVHAALSLPQTTDIQKLNDEDRTELAHRLGYRQIGKELPDDVTLGQIIKSMPQEVRMAFMRTAKHLDRGAVMHGPRFSFFDRLLLGKGCCLARHTAAEPLASHKVLGPSCAPPLQRSPARLAVQQSVHSCHDLSAPAT